MSKFDKKRSSKRRAMEDKVLSKASKYVKISEDQGEEEPVDLHDLSLPTINIDLAPRVKLRKPRHGKQSGQSESSLTNPKVPATKPAPASTSTSKKTKKKKTKKKKDAVQQVATPENEQKHAKEALLFLNTWNSDKNSWKFEKLKQVWLLKHALEASLIDEDNFEILLNFIGSIQGRARAGLQSEMEAVIKNYENIYGDKVDAEPNEEEHEKYERARQVIQMLTDD